jgi:hypothetical protein
VHVVTASGFKIVVVAVTVSVSRTVIVSTPLVIVVVTVDVDLQLMIVWHSELPEAREARPPSRSRTVCGFMVVFCGDLGLDPQNYGRRRRPIYKISGLYGSQ